MRWSRSSEFWAAAQNWRGPGESVLDRLGQATYDLLLLDVSMLETDGLEAARRIVEMHGKRRPRLVALTGHVGAEPRTACRAAGMDDYLRKPLTVAEPSRVLERCFPNRADAGPR